ncbi:unnamed protein product [Blepharisma stoltei]|uniref:NADH dehydrogenase subunit 4 n=1 Tax=Blepharisma stoltei TaxID=1481888 RepID=A0AAU9IEE4_9CILI|nr:unnamed protein product [Blepharisma stoltei]
MIGMHIIPLFVLGLLLCFSKQETIYSRFICFFLCLKLCCHDIEIFSPLWYFQVVQSVKFYDIVFSGTFFLKIFVPIWYFHGKSKIFWNFYVLLIGKKSFRKIPSSGIFRTALN